MMNLNHLAIFRAVAEAGSVSRGAERLMVSQPAVSKQLRQFERALGVVLLDRLPGGVRVTAAGEVLLTHARRLFAEEAEARRALEELRGLKRGRLAIGASMTIGVYLLPGLLAAFRKKHPGVELACEIGNTAEVAAGLLAGRLEVGLTEGPTENEGLVARTFLMDRLVAVVAPGSVLAGKKRVAVKRFLAEPVVMREAGSGTREVVERAFARAGAEVKAALTLASTEAIKRAVMAGLGVGVVSALAVEREVAAGQLAVTEVAGVSFSRPLQWVELKSRQASAAVGAFGEAVEGFSRTAAGRGKSS
jgi:DNA-binding transcriptional LysR family regulator